MRRYKIAVLTATRAEYGLLKPVLTLIAKDNDLDLQVLVTGMHLSEAFGNTGQEIEKDGFAIDVRIPILQGGDTAADISKAMACALEEFGQYFEESGARPDMLVVLGDRYETMAVALAAMNAHIPIAHIHGGETTEGAIDEGIRHAITKLSYLHFASTDAYARRIIQLGENPERVFSVGSLGVENIKNELLMSREELERSIRFTLDIPYAVVTFHPATLEKQSVQEQFLELLEALDNFDMKYIITKANADAGGYVINRMIDDYVSTRRNVFAIASLGMRRYLSALHYCTMLIGNSSSGIVEAPSFYVPTVDIGDRQKGRIAADSVIHCVPQKDAIIEAIQRARSDKFVNDLAHVKNPYDKSGTSKIIVETIKAFLTEEKIDLRKKFYDI